MRRGVTIFFLLVVLVGLGVATAVYLDRRDNDETAAPAATSTTVRGPVTTRGAAGPGPGPTTTIAGGAATTVAGGASPTTVAGGAAGGATTTVARGSSPTTVAGGSGGATATTTRPTTSLIRPSTTNTVPLKNLPNSGGTSRLPQGLALLALAVALWTIAARSRARS